MAEHYSLDGVLTLVDAKHVMRHLDEVKPEGIVNEALAQVAYADRIILNKTDLVRETLPFSQVTGADRNKQSRTKLARCSDKGGVLLCSMVEVTLFHRGCARARGSACMVLCVEMFMHQHAGWPVDSTFLTSCCQVSERDVEEVQSRLASINGLAQVC